MSSALERLRTGSGNPLDPAWRNEVIETAALVSRGVAELVESLQPPPILPRDLTDEHLRAQRFARVRVAEMALYQASQVKAGRNSQNIYSALKSQIDDARQGFQEKFLKESGSMPDYLHQEMVLMLAHNQASLLGPDYPGPLA